MTTCHALLSVIESPAPIETTQLKLRSGGGRTVDARVIAADSRLDLAVLRFDANGVDESPQPLVVGETSRIEKGAFVVILGGAATVLRNGSPAAAFGTIAGTASTNWNGKLPAEIDRDLTPADLFPLWQVTTSITGGTDGGAIVGLDGRLLGITTGRVSLDGAFARSTFGFPVDQLLAPLLQGEEVPLGFLGLEARADASSVEIVRVAAGSPAGEAGLKPGDQVTHWNDEAISDPSLFHRRMWLTPPGTALSLKVSRAGVGERAIELETIRWPVRDSELVFSNSPGRRWRGVTLDAATARRQWLESGLFGRLPTGVGVRKIEPESPGAVLKPGQIITAINGMEIESLDDFLEAAPASGPVRLRLANGESVTVPDR